MTVQELIAKLETLPRNVPVTFPEPHDDDMGGFYEYPQVRRVHYDSDANEVRLGD